MRPLAREDLLAAREAGILDAAQAEALWPFLAARLDVAGAPRFDFTHILYYLGGLIAIGALSLFMNLGWEQFGGAAVAAIALGYMLLGYALALWFERRGLQVPTGIMAALVVVMVPLAVWGVQQALGFWSERPGAQHYRDFHVFIDWRWLIMELATLAAGVVMFWRWRLPFLLMPVAVTLWYLSMDVADMLLFGMSTEGMWSLRWDFRCWFSVGFGFLMLVVAVMMDLRNRAGRLDYPFWIYFFGLLTFWGGLTGLHSDRLSGPLIYSAINLTLIGVGAVLSRRTFVVFGGFGVAFGLSALSWRFFEDSWLFPLALSGLGLALAFLGVRWQKSEARIGHWLRERLPGPWRELLQRRQAGLA